MSRELEKAGLSKALMYGGAGAGGQTAAATGGNVSGGGSNVKGEGTAEAMGLALMNAQKENIEADTEVKRQDKKLKFEETGIKGAENLMQQYLAANTIEGKDAEGSYVNSAAAKMALESVREKVIGNVFQESENARRKAMNIEELRKVQEEIELLRRKGNTEKQILDNLS